jgi:cytochrome c-type biogenesis protein CcmH/NrfG
MIDDSRSALGLDENNVTARSNLALGLLMSSQAEDARAEYDSLLSTSTDTAPIQSAIDDLEEAVRKKPDIAEASKILELLRGALNDRK